MLFCICLFRLLHFIYFFLLSDLLIFLHSFQSKSSRGGLFGFLGLGRPKNKKDDKKKTSTAASENSSASSSRPASASTVSSNSSRPATAPVKKSKNGDDDDDDDDDDESDEPHSRPAMVQPSLSSTMLLKKKPSVGRSLIATSTTTSKVSQLDTNVRANTKYGLRFVCSLFFFSFDLPQSHLFVL